MNATKKRFRNRKFTRAAIVKDWRQNKALYLILLPVLLYFIVFCYLPMFGLVIAFQDYSPALGIFKSAWVGLNNFKDFFGSYFFGRLMKNTLMLSLLDLVFGFPAPIILALALNEVHNRHFKSTLQTVSYMPYFLSLMVVCSLISDFCNPGGAIQSIVQKITGNELGLLSQPEAFPSIYVLSNIWQGVGFQSIIYLAAIAGIDQEQYEAARIDGAGGWRQALHITLPSLAPTIVILLIMRVGSTMTVGYEKILLLYNPGIYDTADVISTFIYRKAFMDNNYGFSAAVGMFNSVINTVLLMITNKISKKLSGSGLF